MHSVWIDSEEGMAACRAIRRAVFIDEQHVPEREEWDDLDAICLHVIALPTAESAWRDALGCARLWLLGDGTAKAQRVAVRAASRGMGVGRYVMDALHAKALAMGCSTMLLSAQTHAIPFYEALGYTAFGELFLDAGIPHRMMRRAL